MDSLGTQIAKVSSFNSCHVYWNLYQANLKSLSKE